MLKVRVNKIIQENLSKAIRGDSIIDNDNQSIIEKTVGVVTSKIKTNDFQPEINKVFWISRALYAYTYAKYMIALENNKVEQGIKLNKENLLIYYPIHEIASEMMLLCKKNIIYETFLFTLARQLVEQLILIKECVSENIDDQRIVEAAIASYNKHVKSNKVDFPNLNLKNHGLFKVFKKDIKISELAKKYRLKWVYEYLSGLIHSPSTIMKLVHVPDNKLLKINLGIILSVLVITLFDVLELDDQYDETLILEEIEIENIYDKIHY